MCRHRRPFPRQKGGRPPSVTARALGVKGTQCYHGWYLRSLHTPPLCDSGSRPTACWKCFTIALSAAAGQVPRRNGLAVLCSPLTFYLGIAIRADHMDVPQPRATAPHPAV